VKRLLFVAVLCSCQSAPKSEPAPSAASAPAAPVVSAPPSAAAPSKAWFEGAWQGSFDAQLLRIELPAGNVKEWKTDDGKRASGEGKLSFNVSADGSVKGTATGALGELAVTGRVEDDRAALQLDSSSLEVFHGAIVAARAGDGFKGALSASSGDSLTVRRADVTLSKAAQ
jgi:hypothetical protein